MQDTNVSMAVRTFGQSLAGRNTVRAIFFLLIVFDSNLKYWWWSGLFMPVINAATGKKVMFPSFVDELSLVTKSHSSAKWPSLLFAWMSCKKLWFIFSKFYSLRSDGHIHQLVTESISNCVRILHSKEILCHHNRTLFVESDTLKISSFYQAFRADHFWKRKYPENEKENIYFILINHFLFEKFKWNKNYLWKWIHCHNFPVD